MRYLSPLIWILTIVLPFWASAQISEVGPAAPAPNIVILLVDDLGYGDIGCYGATKQQTPNLDRMAAEGVRFTDFYMSAPVCSPSRAALMTGCYHKRISVNHVFWPVSPNGLSPKEVTLGEMLQSRGYATRYYGKWHLGDQKEFLPTQQGFDHYHGIPYSHDMGSLVRMKKLIGQLSPVHTRVLPVLRDEKVESLVKDVGPLLYEYESELIDFMTECKEEGKPFFGMLAQHAVHLPNEPGKSYLGTSNNGAYGDWIQEVDASLGRILEAIRSLGLREKTLVLVTSDNGPSKRNKGTAAPLRGYKHSTWEGGVRVPCILSWPGVIPPGQVRREIVACMDIFPTLAALASHPVAESSVTAIDGRSFAPLLLGGSAAQPPRRTFAYYDGAMLQAVRQDQWKLHLKGPGDRKTQLYDLQNDVAESTNLADAHPEIVEELRALADQFREELGDATKLGKGVRKVGQAATFRPLFDAMSHPREGGDDLPVEEP